MTVDLANQFLDLVRAKQLLTSEQLDDVLKTANGDVVVAVTNIERDQLVSAEDILELQAAILKIPTVDLTQTQVPVDILKIIPQETAENYQLVPFKLSDGVVSVACLHPEDYHAVEVLDFIGQQEKLRFAYFLTTPASIAFVLRQYENLNTAVQEALATADISDVELEDAPEEDTKEVVKTAPVSKMISVILKHAIEGAASDVHIEPLNEETRVRYRVDGILHTSLVLPLKVHKALVARIKVLASLKLDETRLPQDGRFKMKVDNRDIEFRVSTLPLLNNEKVVLRILDTSSSVLHLADLGFQDHNLERMQEHLQRPHGLLLITGPTGSGKSTTLYSMISILNQEGVNIITLEDPVEYNLSGIAQSQMKPEIGLTFATGLRSVLRQDPDIIMVGEIRDSETAELAVHAALTGHMVLSTLHTNDAFGAIPRLVDMDVEPFLIASALNVVIAQRLVRKICQHCRELVPASKNAEQDIIAEIKLMPRKFLPTDVKLLPPFTLYRGKGCTHCEGTGYHGRIAINEVLENTKTLSKIIGERQGNDTAVLQAEGLQQGMFSLRQDGLLKVFRGLTTLEEIWNATKT